MRRDCGIARHFDSAPVRGARANDLPDAWIAAQVQVRGLVLVTFDRDLVKLLPAERLQLLSA